MALHNILRQHASSGSSNCQVNSSKMVADVISDFDVL